MLRCRKQMAVNLPQGDADESIGRKEGRKEEKKKELGEKRRQKL